MPARFVERPNRFIVHARLGDGTVVRAHLGDPGRLVELLQPAARLRLRRAQPGSARSTAFTVSLVDAGDGTWVSLETGRANTLARQALERGRVRGFGGTWTIRPEVTLGASRFDFLLTRNARRVWVEVKQVTYARGGTARFPDAPTARGRRHVGGLIDAVAAGDEALVLFVAARGDARRVTPYRSIDPEFADLLAIAHSRGVRLRAARFRFDADGNAEWTGSIPVRA